MKEKAFENFRTVVTEAVPQGTDVQIYPDTIEDGQDIKYATVETAPDLPPSFILNALDQFARQHDQHQTMSASVPNVSPIAILPGSITFEDPTSR